MMKPQSFPLLFAVLTLVSGLIAREPEKSPNVLFIAVDDLRVELGCYGSGHVLSPQIDALAARGMLFERAYCQQALCNPSRASVLTGLRPDTLRVWDLPTHFRETHPEVVTLPQLFRQHGYHARGVGKIFHNWRQDDWKGDEESWSVPSVLHYGTHGADKPKVKGELPPNLASSRGGTECRDVPDEAYYDGRVAKAAIEALREIADAGEPFFLGVGFWKPHTPFNAPKKYWDLYDRETIPLPARVAPPADVPDLALTGSRYRDGLASDRLREMHHGHLAAISYLDAQVGKVLDELDRLGLAENTIIVFWSDHGLHLGEHGLVNKTTTFELDARVPLLIAAPGLAGGRRTAGLVELLDLYPTLTDLCGLDAPPELEGVSLRPLLDDPAATVREAALTQAPRPNYLRGGRPETMGYSIRTDRFRYTEWRDFDTGAPQARELYDHRVDPGETVNLAGREEHRETARELAIRLERLLHEPDQIELPPVAEPGTGALVSSGFVFAPEERPTPSCHSASLVELPSGEIAATWFGGTTEPDIDNVIWFAKQVDDQWTRPLQVVDGTEGEERDHRTGNPVLYQVENGPLQLFYKVVNPEIGRASSWWGMRTTSEDGGKTWSEPRRLGTSEKLGDPNPNLIGPVKNKPFALDGALFCPCSSEHDGWRLHFERSADFGQTWEVIGPVASPAGFSAIQPSLLFHPEGRLQVLCRSREGVITQSWSEDGGKTWTPIAPTHLPNPNSGTDAVTLADGRHLLVYNHTVRGGDFPSNRSLLNVALSDDGRAWKPVLTLERAKGEYSYPAVIQASDGRVHIAYTWKRESIRHVVVDPEELP